MNGHLLCAGTGTCYPLNRNPFPIGRIHQFNIMQNKLSISLSHCQLRLDKTCTVWTVHNESPIGTFVNGRKLTDTVEILCDGDVIKVGENDDMVILVFSVECSCHFRYSTHVNGSKMSIFTEHTTAPANDQVQLNSLNKTNQAGMQEIMQSSFLNSGKSISTAQMSTPSGDQVHLNSLDITYQAVNQEFMPRFPRKSIFTANISTPACDQVHLNSLNKSDQAGFQEIMPSLRVSPRKSIFTAVMSTPLGDQAHPNTLDRTNEAGNQDIIPSFLVSPRKSITANISTPAGDQVHLNPLNRSNRADIQEIMPSLGFTCPLAQANNHTEEETAKRLEAVPKQQVLPSVINLAEIAELELQCSICLELFITPMTLSCGHTFCSVCLNQWNKDRCPTCNSITVSKNKCLVMDSFIDNMVKYLDEDSKARRENGVSKRKEQEPRHENCAKRKRSR